MKTNVLKGAVVAVLALSASGLAGATAKRGVDFLVSKRHAKRLNCTGDYEICKFGNC